MFVTQYQIRGIVVGAIGLTFILYYFWSRKPKRVVTRQELFDEFNVAARKNILSDSTSTNRVASVGVGRSDVTGTSISSRTSVKDNESELTKESTDGMNYGKLGLQSLNDVIDNLESCITKLNKYEEHQDVVQFPQSESRLLFEDLRTLLESAYLMRNKYKQKLIYTDESYAGSDDEDDSSNDSFVSAMEYHVEENIENIIKESIREKRYLYKAALLELDNGNIYYRSRRTDFVKCQSDTDYIAKMHCLRMCFHSISSNKQWIKEIEDMGLKIGVKFLSILEYETDSFRKSFGKLLKFLHKPTAPEIIKAELCDKGVEIITIYDVLFDLILFDALEVLENPPSSIVSVIQNRWLSQSFKKTALSSSVWTILLAKRKFLQYPDGFKAHLYDVLDSIGAPLAWAFLGPDESANKVGGIIQEQLLALASAMYSDSRRWTTEEELAEDIFNEIKSTSKLIVDDLQSLKMVSSDIDDEDEFEDETTLNNNNNLVPFKTGNHT